MMRDRNTASGSAQQKIFMNEKGRKMTEEKDKILEQAVTIWDSDEVKDVEKSNGSGWICHAEITFGYKVYHQGAKNEDTFWKFDVKKPVERETARKAAADYAKRFNLKQPAACLAIILSKARTYLYDTSKWTEDKRWYVVPTYSQGYNDVLKPSLKDVNAGLGMQWVRIGFEPDPFRPTRKGVDLTTGEEREFANLVPKILQTFANEDEAMLAIEQSVDQKSGNTPLSSIPGIGVTKAVDDNPPFTPDVPMASQSMTDLPPNYTLDMWNLVAPDIKKQAAAGTSPADIAKMYELDVKYIVRA